MCSSDLTVAHHASLPPVAVIPDGMPAQTGPCLQVKVRGAAAQPGEIRGLAAARFLTAVQPKLAILSAGARNRSEAHREEVVERYQKAGAEVLRTYEDGAIILETDGKKLRYTGFKSGKKGEITF